MRFSDISTEETFHTGYVNRNLVYIVSLFPPQKEHYYWSMVIVNVEFEKHFIDWLL